MNWAIAIMVVAAYCFVRAVLDLRQKRYWWSAFGFLGAVILVAMPIEPITSTIEITVPGSVEVDEPSPDR